MARLEELANGALVRGVLADRAVKVVAVEWHGSGAITLTYTDDATGRADHELLYRDDEPRLAVDDAGRAWSMDADGNLFRLVSEAKRISLAQLFDPFLAVQTSNLDPLPHQIDAVCNQTDPAGETASGALRRLFAETGSGPPAVPRGDPRRRSVARGHNDARCEARRLLGCSRSA